MSSEKKVSRVHEVSGLGEWKEIIPLLKLRKNGERWAFRDKL